ncbi:VOC family protein [Sinosporangium siamense]|uniref:Uncharacterized protein n=1 Tax=Sinosporangium siamense TaxID=1367973 RepID=A0A919V907_9ACTN|nr:VOC family protein [Sinosporangium siamense]GII93797.1 hypothetical protein Ssi02_40280 [Sinosporangium siamense]
MRANLIVIYTHRLSECRKFYESLGLVFEEEQHGTGPRHFAAVLPGGMVFELYPAAAPGRESGPVRLGFGSEVRARHGYAAGRHMLRDPDGRTIELHVAG